MNDDIEVDRGDLEAQPAPGEERSDREIGGPKGGERTVELGDDAGPEDTTSNPGGHGDKPAPFEPHQ